MAEEWRIVSEFPDYAVSSLGRIRRIKPDLRGRMNVAMLTPSIGSHNYLTVTMHRNAKQVTKTLHRLVCEAFHGPAPSKNHQAAHSDGDRTNNSATNLRWATPSENNSDKYAHGTIKCGAEHHSHVKPECMPRGVAHGNAKLTDESVISIRADRRPQGKIAADYGVSQSLISQIKNGKVWSHVTHKDHGK